MNRLLITVVGVSAAITFTATGQIRTTSLGVRARTSTFSDSWTPVSDDTNTVGWWRSYAGVTFDSSSNVTQVLDASGFGRTMIQISAGDFPFFLTNGLAASKSSLVFDGSADWLYATNFNLEQPASIYLLWKNRGWIVNRRVLNGMVPTGGASTNAFIYQAASQPFVFQRTGSATGAGLNRIDTNNWHMLGTIWSGSNSKIWFNGFHQQGGDPGNGGFGGLAIGGSELGALNAPMEFGELIARVGVDSEDTILKISRYLQRVQNAPFNLLVAEGDSLTTGAGLGPASLWTSQTITNLFPNYNWFQKIVAVGGATVTDMTGRGETTDTYYHANNTTNILAVLGRAK